MSWRSRNRGVAYDERTGLKVRGDRLRQDGEKGIWTTDPDPVHPQRFVRNPGPDGRYWTPGAAKNESHGANIAWRPGTWTINEGWTYRSAIRMYVNRAAGCFTLSAGSALGFGSVINFETNVFTIDLGKYTLLTEGGDLLLTESNDLLMLG